MNNNISVKSHICVISNEPRILAEIKKALMAIYEVSIASTSDAAQTAIKNYKIALIIINISERSNHAFTTYEEIVKFTENDRIPIMFLAETANKNDEKEAFEIGAVDYAIRQPDDYSALISRISLRIQANEAIKELISNGRNTETAIVTQKTLLYGKTLLIVDDVHLNRDLIEGMLSEIEGLTIEMAANGLEAIQKFEDNPDHYSLMLMDIQMPIMGGIEATKKIRSMKYDNARIIPIIALTADVDEKGISKFLETGMNDYIQKPMSFDQLLNLISKYMSHA